MTMIIMNLLNERIEITEILMLINGSFRLLVYLIGIGFIFY